MIPKELFAALPAVKPRFIEPMSEAGQIPEGQEWAYEAKLDGYPCLAARKDAGVTLWNLWIIRQRRRSSPALASFSYPDKAPVDNIRSRHHHGKYL